MKKKNYDTIIINIILSAFSIIALIGFILSPFAYVFGIINLIVLALGVIMLPGIALACMYGRFKCEQLDDKRKGISNDRA